MQIIAQSQAPANSSYIHLAYISVQLQNRISKGELLPVQAMLGVAVATAIACAAIAAKLAKPSGRLSAIKNCAVLGFLGTICLLWFVQRVWSESRGDEAAVEHIIQTRQYWALRDPALARGIEAAAETNATAAWMAASFHGLKSPRWEPPEHAVKTYRFAEIAAAKGQATHWVDPRELTTFWDGHLLQAFETALTNGNLNAEEQTWTKRQLARMTEQLRQESDVK